MKHETFLIVIPCEKVTADLKKTLVSIQKQTYKKWHVVVILTKGTRKKFRKITFEVDQKTRGNPSRKRNYALISKNYSSVLFLDDDVILDPYFLEKASRILKNKEVSAVVGPLLTPASSRFWEKVSDRIWESGLLSLKYSPQKDPPSHKATAGKSDSFQKEIEVQDYPCAAFVMKLIDFKKTGGFSETFFPGEDTKLCLDITQKLGKKIIRSEKVIAYHRRRPFPFGLINQVSRYGYQRGRFSVLFPQTSFHLIYSFPIFFVLYLIGLFGFIVYSAGDFSSSSDWIRNDRLTIDIVVCLPLVLYLFLLTREVAIVYGKEKQFQLTFWVGLGIFLTHVVYGIQFGRGFFSVILSPDVRRGRRI